MIALLRRLKGLLRKQQAQESVINDAHSSVTLCGAVFALFEPCDDYLNQHLAGAISTGLASKARFIGMTSGLLQFVIEDDTKGKIEQKTRAFAKELASATRGHCIVAWTMQESQLGCWGEGTCITFGAIVPNIRQVIRALSSAELGQVVEVNGGGGN